MGLGLITAAVAKNTGAAGGLAMIYIVPMMMFGALLAVFNETTRNIARFMPNYYVSDSLSIIFHTGDLSDPASLAESVDPGAHQPGRCRCRHSAFQEDRVSIEDQQLFLLFEAVQLQKWSCTGRNSSWPIPPPRLFRFHK